MAAWAQLMSHMHEQKKQRFEWNNKPIKWRIARNTYTCNYINYVKYIFINNFVVKLTDNVTRGNLIIYSM